MHRTQNSIRADRTPYRASVSQRQHLLERARPFPRHRHSVSAISPTTRSHLPAAICLSLSHKERRKSDETWEEREREREREMKRDKEWREMRHDMHAWCKLTTMHGWRNGKLQRHKRQESHACEEQSWLLCLDVKWQAAEAQVTSPLSRTIPAAFNQRE
jgi:hypothetical protein